MKQRTYFSILMIGICIFLYRCMDAESIFTSGRIEDRCDDAIPVCSEQAGCVLRSDEYLSGDFPGGQTVIVRTEVEKARLITRFLLVEPMFPGSVIYVHAYSDCGEYDKGESRDKNLFDVAGDDGVIEFHVDVTGRGDHKVEFFSDMASSFRFTVEVEE